MDIKKFSIEGPLLISLKSFKDDRGFFVERFNERNFKAHHLPHSFVQDNFSRSEPGVLRGLHYQLDPSQGKVVSCLNGKIYDVIVDIRKESSTYGQHLGVELSGDNPQHLWIPQGFAHGFCVLGNKAADVLYKVDNYYAPASEVCLLWNDPDLAIDWPLPKPILSAKDQKGILFKSI